MFKEMLKRTTTVGLRDAIGNLRREFRIYRCHLSGARRSKKFVNEKGLKLHIGCGPKKKKGWINIDLNPRADLSLDMREPLPFSENSCSIVYSEHFLEHLDYPECVGSFLRECYRVLEPDGVFSVGVPDTEWPIFEYAGIKKDGYFAFVKERWHPKWCETEMEHINYHFRQGTEHRFAFDFKTLSHSLAKAGFTGIRIRDFDPDLDTEDRKVGTLYAEAIKGAPVSSLHPPLKTQKTLKISVVNDTVTSGLDIEKKGGKF